MNPATSPIRKFFLSLSLAAGLGSLHAVPTILTNFPAGFYLSPTNGGKTVVNLGTYFRVDPVSNTNMVWVTTSLGGFGMELLPTNAPRTVANFLSYVRDGAYESTIIHRSVANFVIQTGGFTKNSYLSAIPTNAPIPSERSTSISNLRGTVSMALSVGSNSATSQWFVNTEDNTFLDSVYYTTNNGVVSTNGPFTVFARISTNGMTNVVDPIAALPTYNLSGANPAFTDTPLSDYTNGASILLRNLVTVDRIATLPYLAFSSDAEAFPADLETTTNVTTTNGISTTNRSTNVIIRFLGYPTNNPTAGVYVTVVATDTNGNSTNSGFFVVPRVLGSQSITFAPIPQQSLSNNATNYGYNLLTNITTNVVSGVTNRTTNTVTNIISTNIYTSFTIDPFPSSSRNVPVLLTIKSGPIQVTGYPNQKTDIQSGTQFTLTGTGTVTLEASTYGTYTNALVNYYYNPAKPVALSFVVKSLSQSITPFQDLSLVAHTFGDPPFQISLPRSTAGTNFPVTVKVKSGPATLKGDLVTMTGAGTVVLSATQGGNAQYAAAREVTSSFTVAKADQTITLPTIPAKTLVMKPFAIVLPTSSSKLPVTTTISGPASLKGKVITMRGEGTVTLTANQSGNANYNAAPTATTTFTVTKADQTITFPAIPSHYTTDRPFAITLPVATSRLPVTISISGPATRNGKVITLTGTNGTVSLVATQGGNAIYNPASVTNSFVVSVKGQSNQGGGTGGSLIIGNGGAGGNGGIGGGSLATNPGSFVDTNNAPINDNNVQDSGSSNNSGTNSYTNGTPDTNSSNSNGIGGAPNLNTNNLQFGTNTNPPVI